MKLSFTPPILSDDTPVCIGVELDEDLVGWQEATHSFVTAQEYAHAQRFVHLIDGVRHLVGRALVRKTLNVAVHPHVIGDFLSTQYGKPYSDQTDVGFSISHSGNMIWAAFCKKGEIGIDVEKVRKLPNLLELAKMFHPQEAGEIKAAPPEDRFACFYRCWVRKEAIIKACGKGLSKPLDSFCVHTDERRDNWIEAGNTPSMKSWFTQDLSIREGYFCSVAVTKPAEGIALIRV